MVNVFKYIFLPACLLNTGYFSGACHFSETNTAYSEIPYIAALASATETTPNFPGGKFRFFLRASYYGFLGHFIS